MRQSFDELFAGACAVVAANPGATALKVMAYVPSEEVDVVPMDERVAVAIAATEADYLALGHWDRPERVGDGTVPAFYSGSPDLAQTVNVIRLTADGEVQVSREKLRWNHP